MTQDELAARLGTDQSRIARWETGKNLPDPIYRSELLSIFGVSEEELFGAHDSRLQPTTDLSGAIEVLSAFEKAEPWRRAVAMYFLTEDESYLDQLPEIQKETLLAVR